MIQVEFYCDDVDFQWNDNSILIQWISDCLKAESQESADLSFIYCSDDRLLHINKQYLNHDYFTDVITFDLSESAEVHGEIYCSLDRINENAQANKELFERELCRIMVHGMLHLLGYKDGTPEEKTIMRSKEDTYLSLLADVPRGTFE